MSRIVKWVAIALAVVVGVVAAFFGALVLGAILVAAALLAFFGKGKFRLHTGRAPQPPGNQSVPPPQQQSHAGGDVIDIEARKVETPRELT